MHAPQTGWTGYIERETGWPNIGAMLGCSDAKRDFVSGSQDPVYSCWNLCHCHLRAEWSSRTQSAVCSHTWRHGHMQLIPLLTLLREMGTMGAKKSDQLRRDIQICNIQSSIFAFISMSSTFCSTKRNNPGDTPIYLIFLNVSSIGWMI